MGFDFRLEQIAEHVDAGAHFRDPSQVLRVAGGGGTAGRDDADGVSGIAQTGGGGGDRGALGFGETFHVAHGTAGVGMAGMGHHAYETVAEARA